MRLRFQSTSADRYEVARKERGQLSPTLPFPQELFKKIFKTPQNRPPQKHLNHLNNNGIQKLRIFTTFLRRFRAVSVRLGHEHREPILLRLIPEEFRGISTVCPGCRGRFRDSFEVGALWLMQSNGSRILRFESVVPIHTIQWRQRISCLFQRISDSG